MFELKPLSRQAIPGALEKAHRYRLLNEPAEAESICRDVLEIDPGNQQALVALVLALSDQLDDSPGSAVEAREYLAQVEDEYARLYYGGILIERRAKATLHVGGPGSGGMAYDYLRQAMELFERAIAVRPPDNDDSILRWNTCVRLIATHPELQPAPVDTFQPLLE
jgi:tetratricopeptide (TPR) repeat protein